MNTSHVITKDKNTDEQSSQEGLQGLRANEAASEVTGSGPPVRLKGKWRAVKITFAFLFGAVSFVGLFQLCEVLRPEVVVGLGAVGFLVCQYLLSRGNSRAATTDLGMVLAMNALPMAVLACALVVGMNQFHASEVLKAAAGVALGLGCSYAGTVIAARTARA